jgi:predicted DCC family thiol-disulfide oxidoreductase YuxK
MDRPEAVLIYDGQCRFCIAQAERLARWARGRVRLESFRDEDVLLRFPALTRAQCEKAIQLVEPDGRVSSGAAAVARTLRMRPLLASLGHLYEVPLLRSAFDWGYALVARNRFRIGGAACDDACDAHRRAAGAPPPPRPERERSA